MELIYTLSGASSGGGVGRQGQFLVSLSNRNLLAFSSNENVSRLDGCWGLMGVGALMGGG